MEFGVTFFEAEITGRGLLPWLGLWEALRKLTPAPSQTCCLFAASPASGMGKLPPVAPQVRSPCRTVACSACWRRNEADDRVRVIRTTAAVFWALLRLGCWFVFYFTPFLIGSLSLVIHSFIHSYNGTSQITPNKEQTCSFPSKWLAHSIIAR